MNQITIGEEFAVECRGVRVPHSPYLPERRIDKIRAGGYEPEEIAGALAVVRPGDRVLELGAGLGIVGAVMASNAGPSAVISFEANPALIPHIRALYDMNGLGGVISVRNEVLLGGPDRPATMPFHIGRSFFTSSLLNESGRETVDVPTGDLAEVMAEFDPQVMLVDIEGGELDLLRHADLTRLRAAVVEFHPAVYGVEGMRECKQALRAAGLAKIDAHSTRTVWTCARG
jgi:FkbM family methyltransferase